MSLSKRSSTHLYAVAAIHGRSHSAPVPESPNLGRLEHGERRGSFVLHASRRWRRPQLIALLLFLISLVLYVRAQAGTHSNFAQSPHAPDVSLPSLLSGPSSHHRIQPLPVKRHESGLAFFDMASLASRGLAEHPILSLMRNASQAWEEKVARQSKTLAEAVAEYKRRYRRNPPKGFDRWYEFASSNNVVLIDEYDNIDKDIRPFFALSYEYLQERIAEYAAFANVDTMMFKDGKVAIQPAINNTHPMHRTISELDLIENCCASWLEEANVTITPSDGPSVIMAAEHYKKHLDAVDQDRLLTPAEAQTVIFHPAHGPTWWSAHCEAGSRFRRNVKGLEAGNLPPGSSFIYDHESAMDLCKNPEMQQWHGFTSWGGMTPIKLYPVFAYSRSAMHADIRLVPLEQYRTVYKRQDPEWEAKPFAKAIWRGSTTGSLFFKTSQWQSTQRVRLYWLANNATGSRKVRVPSGQSGIHEVELDSALLGDAYLDFKFSGNIVQCDRNDGTCDLVREAIPYSPGMKDDQLLQYKYVLDIDGNAWSGRFHRLMSSNSLVLKSTIFPEWYSDRIQPWVHYVPVKTDYTDLFDIMSFFAGDLDGNGHHDELAKEIAYAGRDWAKTHWRVEDMQAYNARLFLEWARVTAPDRKANEYLG